MGVIYGKDGGHMQPILIPARPIRVFLHVPFASNPDPQCQSCHEPDLSFVMLG